MNTNDKCQAIVETLLELVNKGEEITFKRDFGGNTITCISKLTHGHVTPSPETFNKFVTNLLQYLSTLNERTSGESNVFY